MVITLPKVKRNGEFVKTLVKVNDINGCEPALVNYQGKQWNGTKIFVQGGSFFVLAPLSMIASAMTQALQGNSAVVQMVKDNPVKVIPAPIKATAKLLSSKF